MGKRIILTGLLMLFVLMGMGCQRKEEVKTGVYEIYYLDRNENHICPVSYETDTPKEDKQKLTAQMLEQLSTQLEKIEYKPVISGFTVKNCIIHESQITLNLSGEYVNPEHQRVIEEVFGCRTSNQYGCREYWPMAYSDVNGGLHVVTDNIYIEQIYNKEHNMNEIVITLLKNNSWPLIRYKLEDLGNYIFEDSQIKLTLNRGRKADFFVLKGNRRFNAIVFSGIARSICELYGSNVILQFQVQKINDDQLDVYLRMKDGDKKQEIVNRYKQEIQKILGEDVIINLYETDYIKPDPKTGKTKEFIG